MDGNDEFFSHYSAHNFLDFSHFTSLSENKHIRTRIRVLEKEISRLRNNLFVSQKGFSADNSAERNVLRIYDAVWINNWFVEFSESDLSRTANGLMMRTNFEFDNEFFDFSKETALLLRDFLNELYPV